MVETHIATNWPYQRWQGLPMVLGCSGGADSTALLRAMVALAAGNTRGMVVAHFDHQWRGEESEADAEFVRDLANQWGLVFRLGHPANAKSKRNEATARELRHQFLLDVANAAGARHIVLAHTADDQAETVLHRILRGTAVAGLAGMPRVRALSRDVSLVRPMLTLRRTEILEYLARQGQAYRDDTSNQDRRFTRNRIRHDLLPQLQQQYNPQVVDALLKLSLAAQDVMGPFEAKVERLLEESLANHDDGNLVLDASVLANRDHRVVVALFRSLWRRQRWPERQMDRSKWRSILDLVQSPGGALTLPGDIQLKKTGAAVTLSRHHRPLKS